MKPQPVDNAVVRSLKDSLIACGAAKHAGTTWADFKAAIEQLGITDSDRIASVEYGIAFGGRGYIVKDEEGGEFEVREI